MSKYQTRIFSFHVLKVIVYWLRSSRFGFHHLVTSINEILILLNFLLATIYNMFICSLLRKISDIINILLVYYNMSIEINFAIIHYRHTYTIKLDWNGLCHIAIHRKIACANLSFEDMKYQGSNYNWTLLNENDFLLPYEMKFKIKTTILPVNNTATQ